MVTMVAPAASAVKRMRKATKLSLAECWHLCPSHAAMYPGWKDLSDADQIEIGVMWKHGTDEIAKLDQYERLCPQCRHSK
jgi:hypothetical protein